MARNPVFSVVVTFAGRFDMLELCMNSIYKNATHPMTITIVDDASPKAEKVHYPQLFTYDADKDIHKNVISVTCKRQEKQEGFPRSANSGAKSSKSPYITFISDDVELHAGYFDIMYEKMKDTGIGIVGAKLLFPPTSTSASRPAGKIQHIGVAMDVRANSVHPLVGWSPDNPKTQISRDVLATTGALLTIRGEIFRSVGGFDLVYGLGYWEDVDLCLKVRQKGYRIWLENSASAYHYTGASGEKGINISQGFQQNAMTFRSRWGNTGLLVYDLWTYG